MKQLYTKTEAAEYLGVSLDTIKRYITKGILPVTKLPSVRGTKDMIRIRLSSLEALCGEEPQSSSTGNPIVLNVKEAS